ncbi:nitroreductase family deazaflavin-dependent oxidoreductase [Agromyces silvae]|uniref:nitroreductase family deazaflavin-dependent oxidoreductase n=1 Tax=Agromyces silvae TaxID=3388266 RepID=UPI00280ADB65|nr:nitroreductase family deazaflavin-dependent oxidoreductase [Agromyces protaetiae]
MAGATAGAMMAEQRVPKVYHHGRVMHLANRAMTALTRAGLVPHAAVLTVTGRTSGLPRSTPVTAIEQGGALWLVSPYGTVSWVRNARASGEVTLAKRRTTRRFAVREATPAEAGPVLKRYVAIAPIVLPYFVAGRHDPAEAFAAEADRHPVFELVPLEAGEPGSPSAR